MSLALPPRATLLRARLLENAGWVFILSVCSGAVGWVSEQSVLMYEGGDEMQKVEFM